MSTLTRLACACALTASCSLSFATLGELGPYSSSTGEGNIGFGAYQDHFVATRGFAINWYDSPVPPSARFMDLQGSVGSVFATSEGLAPFVFKGVSLWSQDGATLYGSFDASQPSATINFSFNNLSEGRYSLKFDGQYVRSPYEEGWGVQEWQYAVSAVASPSPEASDLAMTAMGMIGVVVWARRYTRRAR